MKGWRIRLLSVIVLGLAVFVGCAQSPGSVPETGRTGQAAVQSLEVAQVVSQTGAALSPGELRALVRGTLTDNCTQLADPVVSQSHNFIVVILEQQPAAGVKAA